MHTEIDDLKENFKRFRGVLMQSLELLSPVQLQWKPFENYRTLGEQFYHIAQVEDFYTHGLFVQEWNLERTSPQQKQLTHAEIESFLQETRLFTTTELEKLEPVALDTPVSIPNIPVQNSVRDWLWYLVEHEVHHKAQLAVFMRQLGVEPPFFAFVFPNRFRPDQRQ